MGAAPETGFSSPGKLLISFGKENSGPRGGGFHKIARNQQLSGECLVPWRKTVMMDILQRLWSGDEGQDIAEYAVMLAVILVIVVGTIRLIGSNANNVFSSVASSIQ